MERFEGIMPYLWDFGFVLVMVLVIYFLFTLRRNKSSMKQALKDQQAAIKLQENSLEAIHELNKKMEILITEVRHINSKCKDTL